MLPTVGRDIRQGDIRAGLFEIKDPGVNRAGKCCYGQVRNKMLVIKYSVYFIPSLGNKPNPQATLQNK